MWRSGRFLEFCSPGSSTPLPSPVLRARNWLLCTTTVPASIGNDSHSVFGGCAQGDHNNNNNNNNNNNTAIMSTLLKSTTVKPKEGPKKKFFTWLGLGVGTVVSRTWKFGPGKKHTIVLEHDCMTGRRQVWLNKKLVHNQTVFPDRSFEIFVDVDGKQGKIRVENKIMKLQVHYHFDYDGEEQVSSMFDTSCKTTLENVLSVSIPEVTTEVRVFATDAFRLWWWVVRVVVVPGGGECVAKIIVTAALLCATGTIVAD